MQENAYQNVSKADHFTLSLFITQISAQTQLDIKWPKETESFRANKSLQCIRYQRHTHCC